MMDTLPSEILFETLLYLNISDIKNISQLSKKYRDIGSNDLFWKIKYEKRGYKMFNDVQTSNNLLKYLFDEMYLRSNNILQFSIKSNQLKWLKYPAICNLSCEKYDLSTENTSLYFEYLLIEMVTTIDLITINYYFLDVTDSNHYKALELMIENDKTLQVGKVVKTFSVYDTFNLKPGIYGVEADNEFHYYIKVSTQLLDYVYHKYIKNLEIKTYVNDFLNSIGYTESKI